MIAAIYVRVSTEDQTTNFSIPSQKAECIKRAKELGAIEIREFIDDGYSAAFLDRPGMNALRDAIKNKEINLFVCFDPDRFARNLSHQLIITEEIEKSGAKIEFVNSDYKNTPEGKLFYSIRGAFSEYEREKIRERSMRGKKAKAEAGKIVNNAKPYGYRYNKELSLYEIHEEESEMIRNIFKWYTEEKLGFLKIAERLALYGYKTRTGINRWNLGTIAKIIKNELYTGTAYAFRTHKRKTGPKQVEYYVRPEEEWVPIPIPAIIDYATFEAAKQQSKINTKLADRNSKSNILLRGLVYCPICNQKYKLGTEKKCGTTYKYYRCSTGKIKDKKYIDANPESPCNVRQIPAELLDQLFWEQMVELSSNPDILIEMLENALENDKNESENLVALLDKLEETEAKLNGDKEKILRLLRQDLITEKEAEKELKDIRDQLNNIGRERKIIEIKLSDKEETLREKDSLVDKLKFYSGKLEDADFETARNVVLNTIDGVIAQRVDKAYKDPVIDFRIKFKF